MRAPQLCEERGVMADGQRHAVVDVALLPGKLHEELNVWWRDSVVRFNLGHRGVHCSTDGGKMDGKTAKIRAKGGGEGLGKKAGGKK